MKRGPTPSRSSQWGTWFEDRSRPALADGSRVFGNGLFTVHAHALDPDRGLAGAVHLSIHDNRRTTKHDWREFQRIKSELMGAEREAVELYPAESRVIDTSNEYHLWVFPEDTPVGIGFDSGRVVLDAGEEVDPDLLDQAADSMGVDRGLVRRNVKKARQRKLVDR